MWLNTCAAEDTMFFKSTGACRPIYRRWVKEKRFVKLVIVCRLTPPPPSWNMALSALKIKSNVRWRRTAHHADFLYSWWIEKILFQLPVLVVHVFYFQIICLQFSALLIPSVFVCVFSANRGVMSLDLCPGAHGLRRSCTWLWWPVGIVWTRPSPW